MELALAGRGVAGLRRRVDSIGAVVHCAERILGGRVVAAMSVKRWGGE